MLPEGGGPSVSADRTGVAIGVPGRGQGPRGPGLPHGHPGGGDAAPGPGRGGLQGADDPAGGMRRAHLGPGGEPPAVLRGVQGPHGPHWRPGGPGGGEGQLALVYPPITADNVHSVVGKDYRKKNYPVEMKHVFWAHMECGLVLSSVGTHPEDKRGDPGGLHVQVYWRAGGGGSRLLQIRAGKAILQLVLDEPPEGLYNRWVKERLEYYRRVEPSAPLRDVSIVDQKVPRFRFSREPGPGADQSSGQVHHGDGQVQPGVQCALQRRAAHLAADGQVHEQHPGAAGLANEDHVGHQTERSRSSPHCSPSRGPDGGSPWSGGGRDSGPRRSSARWTT